MARYLIIIVLLLSACATNPVTQPTSQPQEVKITIDSNQPIERINIEDGKGDKISRSMEIQNIEGELSRLSFVSADHSRAFIKIFSGLSVSDTTSLWNDFIYLEHNTDVREVTIFINSPGGDAFSGLALADEIERAQRKGFKITVHASGIVASAAVPVLAVCNERLAAPGTVFMVHEAALWKWPGRETASDIRSQNELMSLLQERYISKLVANSKLDRQTWESMEKRTTWFSAEQAMQYGLIDRIE